MPIFPKVNAGFIGGNRIRTKSAEQNKDTRTYSPVDGLQSSPILAAIQLHAKSVSSAEVIVERLNTKGVWEKVPDDEIPEWANPYSQPNPWQSHKDFIKTISYNLNVFGNCILRPLDRDWKGFPNQVVAHPWYNCSVTVDGNTVTPEEIFDTGKLGIPGYGTTSSKIVYSVDGVPNLSSISKYEPNNDVLHIKRDMINDLLFGYSPLYLCAPQVRTQIAADAFAELSFINGFMPPGILAHKAGKPGQGVVDTMVKYFLRFMKNPHNVGAPGVVSGAWDFIKFGNSPEQMQLLDARMLTFCFASAMYGPVPELIGFTGASSTTGSGYRYAELTFAKTHGQDHVENVYRPMSACFMPSDYRVRALLSHLTKLDELERSRVHERSIGFGWKLPSEVRQEEGLPPVDDSLMGMPFDRFVLENLIGKESDKGGLSDSGKDTGQTDENPTDV